MKYYMRIFKTNAWKDFITKNHYLHSAPAGCKIAFQFLDGSGHTVGVAVLGHPVARLENPETLELTRFWFADECPRNTESWALGQIRRFLAKYSCCIRIIAYSDPQQGHKGTIYKAAGWNNIGTTGKGNWNNREKRKSGKQSSKLKWELLIPAHRAYGQVAEVK